MRCSHLCGVLLAPDWRGADSPGGGGSWGQGGPADPVWPGWRRGRLGSLRGQGEVWSGGHGEEKETVQLRSQRRRGDSCVQKYVAQPVYTLDFGLIVFYPRTVCFQCNNTEKPDRAVISDVHISEGIDFWRLESVANVTTAQTDWDCRSFTCAS